MKPNNTAINPNTQDSYDAVMMRTRSKKIKTVHARESKNGIAGATNVSSGEVFIPTGRTAFERVIRFHEALHAAHTPARAGKAKDLLDQALEDARLHRYKSQATRIVYAQARRDELTVALRDLRTIQQKPAITPTSSLAAFRAYAILSSAPIKKEHRALLSSVLNLFGRDAERDMQNALDALKDSDGRINKPAWQKARKVLAGYFRKDFDGKIKSKSPESFGKGDREPGSESQSQSTSSETSDSNAQESQSTSKSTERKDESESGESSTGGDKSDESQGESEGDASEGEPDDDTDSDGGSDSESESGDEEIPEEIAPLAPQPKKPKEKDTDEYQGDLTPACDKETFEQNSQRHPLKIFIRRLDMMTNRVNIELGQGKHSPVVAGRKLISSRLASGAVNPQARLFQRKIQHGNAGTILIDASSSMRMSDAVLQEFLAVAPALTLAFYNARTDSADSGQIFIYAANGFRAHSLDPNLKKVYGGIPRSNIGGWGNVIDYHAMAWLIKQPAPRFIITDWGFTGYWSGAATELAHKLIAAKQIEVVPTLAEMQKILNRKGKS